MKKLKKIAAVSAALALVGAYGATFAGCSKKDDTVTLRVSSWEEYIDLGGWKDDELIEIDNPYNEELGGVIGKNSMVEDFTEWFNSTHDFKVKVEYSTFGTNEDLYNRLSLGDVYDLVCPSDYMLMKLIAEGACEEYSEEFLNNGWYTDKVSPYIKGVFTDYGWEKYAACYMWGTTGVVYNPDKINDISDVNTWEILLNENYNRRVTVKDNVRDAYFVTLGILNKEKLTGELTKEERSKILNDTDSETIAKAEDVLKRIKDNVYSFETDAGKSDMVTGKVVANYQWSGDSVFIMDEAESDESSPVELWYSVPEECTNLWFDGWVMLKNGIDGNEQRRTAAEAFVNFLSRPDNAVRNMNYIGYTSAIADDTVFDYMKWNYGDEEAEDVFEYDLSYFFGDSKYKIKTDAANFDFEDEDRKFINRGRQLFTQYPSQNVIERSTVMLDFGDKLGDINQMWINVRCLDVKDIPVATIVIVSVVIVVVVVGICLYAFRYKIFTGYKPKKGYERVEE
ncbi:MAG: extracellular solute-binding protein [Clostridia bacterium]|nr:extracellular solute-binding protein [Clostridia bacterium]